MILVEIDATHDVGCQMMITENDHGHNDNCKWQ